MSRRGFLDTLEDTLGFSPKVDFNAGVVAAGEAQIESTVTGNEPGTFIANDQIALKDQSQVGGWGGGGGGGGGVLKITATLLTR